MRIYTVHQPPERWREARRGRERFAFVRDGFHFWAFVLAPIWMVWHRLFVVLIGFLAATIVLEIALAFAGASDAAQLAGYGLLTFLVGLEASSLRRWTLRRRGWREVGVVSAEDQEAAAQRFFDRWDGEAEDFPPAPPPAQSRPAAAASGIRRPVPQSGAIGLFPEPGAAP